MQALYITGAVASLLGSVAPEAVWFASGRPGGIEAFWDRQAAAVATTVEKLGPTAIKFGQAAANRPDLVGPRLADELRLLQDSVAPFPLEQARRIIVEDLPAEAAAEVLAVLPASPVAAASLGQVYKLEGLPSAGGKPVALKLLRPGARQMVAEDSLLARGAAARLEALTWGGERLIKPALVDGVDEFFGRLFEEMEYANEQANLQRFGALYGRGGRAAKALARSSRENRLASRGSGAARSSSSSSSSAAASAVGSGGVELLLPTALPRWTSGRCIAMSWVDGEPLLASRCATLPASELPLVRFGIEATLSQMLDEGYMHADPHGGNLLRAPPRPASRPRRLVNALLRRQPPPPRLAYLDFGLVSEVPQQVRDGLVCAVAYLLFANDTAAVAGLFSELMLLPEEELQSETTRADLERSLSELAKSVLVPPTEEGGLPTLAFERLITGLALLAPRFKLQLPPYFLNNARALATLEGMAKSADPSFDVLQAVYPFALRRLLCDPKGSPLLRSTLLDLTRGDDGRLDPSRVAALMEEGARLSGRSRRQLVADAWRTPGGRRLGLDVAQAYAGRLGRRLRGRR